VNNKPNDNQQTNAITAEGWLYLVILAFISAGAVLRNVNLLVLMSGMMIAPLIINWRLGVLRARTLQAKRSLPYRVHAQSLSGVQWICFNRSSIAAWGIEVLDSLVMDESRQRSSKSNGPDEPIAAERLTRRVFQAFKAAASSALKPHSIKNIHLTLPGIGGNQQEVVTSRIYFAKRGVYRFGPAQLITRFPFGLIATTIEIDKTEELYVAPQLGVLTPVWDRRVRSILAGADALLKRRGLAGDDFYALRRWRSGDSRKLIHWRTSAKYGYPIVKQFEEPDNRDFALLLDLFASDVNDSDMSPEAQACETCLSFAATVILNLGSAVRGRVALAICGSETTLLQSRSQREMIELAMRAMAVVRGTPGPELVSSLIKLADSVSPRTPLVVVSSRPSLEKLADELPLDTLTRSKLNSLWPSVVWLSVDSLGFEELFQLAGEDDELQALAKKWSENVPH
jgi:uncharacterized protein (DUF58 family)